MNEQVEMFISKEKIATRVKELGALIMEDYKGEPLVVLGTLKGSFIFMADLVRELEGNITLEFIRVSSYGNSTRPEDKIRFEQTYELDIVRKNVLLMEDIIDTGKTVHFLLNYLKGFRPKSLKVCTLLDKPSRREVFGVICDYVGFTLPDEFVVGYGLDYAQKYRNLPYVGILRLKEV